MKFYSFFYFPSNSRNVRRIWQKLLTAFFQDLIQLELFTVLNPSSHNIHVQILQSDHSTFLSWENLITDQSISLKWSFHKYPQTNSPDWPQYIPWRISWENLIKAQSISLRWSLSEIFTYNPSYWPVYEFDYDQSIFLDDHFVNSRNLFRWLNIVVVRRKLMWVTLRTGLKG